MAVSSNKKYGLPYQGSKRRIADKIIDLLPRAPVLVDLFAGGCAVTHAALESGKFESVIANDLSDAPVLFYYVSRYGVTAPRWVSREEFFAKKDNDPFIKYIYSFGNAGRSYLYGRNVEPLKYAGHRAVVDGDCSYLPEFLREKVDHALAGHVGVLERYARYKAAIRGIVQDRDADNLEHLDRIKRLQHIGCIKRLQNLECIKRLQHIDSSGLAVTQKDYRNVHIPNDAIVYCDPPYACTAGYAEHFDHNEFYDWCRAVAKSRRIFVSEYQMPADFKCIAEFEVRALAEVSTRSQLRVEKLFILD